MDLLEVGKIVNTHGLRGEVKVVPWTDYPEVFEDIDFVYVKKKEFLFYMKRFPSIKKNSDFQNIYRNGKSYANRLLVMYVMRNGEESNQLGISVSKKVGNSVVRHHIARLMREIFRLNNEKIETGLNIIVVARTAAATSDYKHLEGAYMHLCGLHHILKESK